MENKYYQPTFEDFVPNLEYEYFTGNGWQKKKYDTLEHKPIAIQKLQHELSLNPDRFRVKYLDTKDLIELGYGGIVDDRDYLFSNNKGTRIAIDDDEGYVNILHRSNSYYFGEDGFRTIFIGKIPNKTELKRILKMIGI